MSGINTMTKSKYNQKIDEISNKSVESTATRGNKGVMQMEIVSQGDIHLSKTQSAERRRLEKSEAPSVQKYPGENDIKHRRSDSFDRRSQNRRRLSIQYPSRLKRKLKKEHLKNLTHRYLSIL